MKLYYKQVGEVGKPLIIIHGLFGMSDNWRSIAKRLSEQYSVYLLDMRNHGKSPHSLEMNYYAMCDDLLEFVNDMHLNSILLMGHSMGGKVAMRFAADHADLVKKLAVIDIAPKAYPPLHSEIFEALLALDPSGLGTRRKADELLAQNIPAKATRLFLLKNLKKLPKGGYDWRCNLFALHLNYDILSEASLNSNEFFDGDCLFVRGEKSKYILPEVDMPLIHKYFPNARLSAIPDAGHWVHADQAETLLQVLRGFLED